MRRILILVLLALSLPAAAAAQTITLPARIAEKCGFGLPGSAAGLTLHLHTRNHRAFRSHAEAVVGTAVARCAPGERIDFDRDVVQLLWVDANPLSGEKVVYRALLQKDEEDPASALLPGVRGDKSRRFFEVFIAPRPFDGIVSVYTSTRGRNPAEEQLPALAQAAVSPLLTMLAATSSALTGDTKAIQAARAGGEAAVAAAPAATGAQWSRPAPAPSSVPSDYATISRIDLPFHRSGVHVDARVTTVINQAEINKAAGQLSTANQFGAHFDCVRAFDAAMKTAVEEKSGQCGSDPDSCSETLRLPFQTAFKDKWAACTTEAEQTEMLAVDASYRGLVGGLEKQRLAAFDLKNAPHRLISFGVMTAYAFRGRMAPGETRVSLNDGNLTLDPLGRLLNLVVVNVGFTRYNAESFHPTPAERYQWFAGAVVTPDFGVATGLSVGIVRGLTANVGVGLLAVRGLRDADVLGAPPTKSQDPFKMSRATVAFFGLGYKFQ